MKLLIIDTFCDRPEVEIFRLMAARGHTVHVVAHPQSIGAEVFAAANIGFSFVRIRHRLDFRAVSTIRRLIEQIGPDLIYAPRNSSLAVTLMAARRKFAVPVVGYRGTMGHLSHWDPASWLTYLHPRLAHIICVSEAVRQYLLGMRIPESRLSTIYKGHRVAWYTNNEPLDLAAFGVPPGAVTVGFVGNIRPVKGVDVLLQSLLLIPPELNVHCCLIGEIRDPAVEKLCRLPALAGLVHLAGYQPDAARYCASFSMFVMPSVEREGLPRAVIEAMARQIPPIVSDVGGMPEMVENGVSGFVVPPRDPARLAEAICALARSPALRRQYGANAQKRIETCFNVEDTTDKMLALFTRLLG